MSRRKSAPQITWDALLQRADGHQSVVQVQAADEAAALLAAEEVARPTHVTLRVSPAA